MNGGFLAPTLSAWLQVYRHHISYMVEAANVPGILGIPIRSLRGEIRS